MVECFGDYLEENPKEARELIMKSIIAHLGTEKFDRIRIGIGKPEHNDLINYVIGKIKEEDYKVLEEGIKKAADATICLIKEGTAKAMNKFNKV